MGLQYNDAGSVLIENDVNNLAGRSTLEKWSKYSLGLQPFLVFLDLMINWHWLISKEINKLSRNLLSFWYDDFWYNGYTMELGFLVCFLRAAMESSVLP